MFPFKTILHPTDFSERSALAFRLACSLARDYGARLILLHVAEPPRTNAVEGVAIPPVVVDWQQLREQLLEFQPESPRFRWNTGCSKETPLQRSCGRLGKPSVT